MTRRGSLVYYSAAVVVGGFFTALALTLTDRFLAARWSPGFLPAYSGVLIQGACPLLLYAFLLRTITKFFRQMSVWSWLAVGAVVALAVMYGLGALQNASDLDERWFHWVRTLSTRGPQWLSAIAAWLALPIGGATAYVLFLIHRAFEPRSESDPADLPRG